MQNKGLVLSVADVQALRQAGFTPKGTLMKGAPTGMNVGGFLPSAVQGAVQVLGSGGSNTTSNNQSPFGQGYTGTSNTPYSGPMSGGPMSGNPNATPPSQDQLGTNQQLVYGPDGWMIRNLDTVNQGGGPLIPMPGNAGAINENKVVQVTGSENTTGTTGIPQMQPLTDGMTQRERLLGEEGAQTFAESQRALQESAAQYQQIATAAPAPVATPSAVLTPASVGQAATAQAAQMAAPTRPELSEVEAVLSSDEVKNYLNQVRAAEGEIRASNLVNAATQDPATLRQLQIDAKQIQEAQQVADVTPREVQAGEMISGPAVEQERVEDLVSQIQAQTAEPSELATVQGQLAKLTADFDTKNPPAWAAGALRNATAQMAARGLGASSLAGQAIIQATFEAATPIAAADAATVAQFEQMNLSNRQQATLLAAQQRAQFLNQEFDQAFQTKVANAARISEIANMNFDAEVQIALENARMAQSVDIANLNAANAKVLADAAAMSNMELTNLNNRQQAAVANAKAFLDMDVANLNNEQQTNMFKAQSAVQAMLSDQAAENAARNLNTTNENQLNQFFAQLEANAAQFNAAQSNAIAQSNVSELNAMVRFKEEQENNLKITYDRNQTAISTARIGAEATMQAAATRAAADQAISAAANETKMTLMEMEQQYQREADIMAMTYDTMKSKADKAFELVKLDMAGQIQIEAAQWELDAAQDAATKRGLADIAIGIVEQVF